MSCNREFWFKKISDEGIAWEFQKSFPHAFAADRWAMRQFEKWCSGQISFRIIFEA